MTQADLATMSQGQLIAMIAALKAKAATPNKLTLKVSAKGAVSLYGMGRWPVTLYSQQWKRVLDHADAIHEFIATNADALSVKDAD